jgi:hypothetical protein
MKSVFAAIASTAAITALSAYCQCVAELSAVTGKISPPFVVTNGYIFQPLRTAVTNGGRAVYTFTTPSPGRYALQAVVEAANQNANSLFISIDSEPKNPGMKWEIPFSSGFTTNWVFADTTGTPKWFDLTNGTHQIIIRGSDPNVKLSHISIQTRPSPPTGLHIVNGP